ncbi:Kelch repeat-containing protein [Paenibacillus sp. LS1]|uniref:Kelch repeat-containing protein n=1 Tax=Paenibacillus sp. LS1 TaxID=2992120 RepID=UPI0029F4B447|nr:kelch repeat-containing protein [Paenibacillus sp. LS1]
MGTINFIRFCCFFEWVTKADLLEPRTGGATASLNGKIYYFGGASGSDHAASGIKQNSTYEYDPTTDTWTVKANMPTARAGLTAVVYDNKIYAIGGYYNVGTSVVRTNKVEVYDPSTDSWTTAANLLTARSWASSVALDGKIYVFGGGALVNGTSTSLSSVESYDPISNTWSLKNKMPIAANAAATASVDGKVYMFGGANLLTSSIGGIYEYDPALDSWTLKQNTTVRDSSGIAVYHDKIYLLGGGTFSSGSQLSALNSFDVYDPKTNTFNKVGSLTSPRSQLVSAVINNNLYIIGGTSLGANGTLKNVEMYTFENESTPSPDPTPESGNKDRAIFTVILTTGLVKEFDISMVEVNKFIAWYEGKEAGTGTASYAINKHENNKGPFTSRKDYVIFKNILSFEVDEYSTAE